MIDWNRVPHFKASDFSEDPNKYLTPEVLYNVERVRIAFNKAIYPSPVTGALARLGGSNKSQHYVGVDSDGLIRKSTAVDLFPTGLPINFFICVMSFSVFKGIGIYLDTTGIDGKPWIMFHVDTRKIGYNNHTSLIWIAEKVVDPTTKKITTQYRYPQIQPEYWKLLQDDRLYIYRTKNGKTKTRG